MKPCTTAVIIPCLNERDNIAALLASVMSTNCLCVVSDGGSTDGTVDIAAQSGARVVTGPAGRARQMNAGAKLALREHSGLHRLVFMHADSTLPPDWLEQCRQCPAHAWGRFDVDLRSTLLTGWRARMVRTIGWFMNERSALTGICTGDQGFVISSQAWAESGGFPELPLMEDIEMSRMLKKHAGSPCRLRGPIGVSARRWEQAGVLQTMVQMWQLRLRWFFGESADSIARRYYPGRFKA